MDAEVAPVRIVDRAETHAARSRRRPIPRALIGLSVIVVFLLTACEGSDDAASAAQAGRVAAETNTPAETSTAEASTTETNTPEADSPQVVTRETITPETVEQYLVVLAVPLQVFAVRLGTVQDQGLAMLRLARDDAEQRSFLQEVFQAIVALRGAFADELERIAPPQAVAEQHEALIANARAHAATDREVIESIAVNDSSEAGVAAAAALQQRKDDLAGEAAAICEGFVTQVDALGLAIALRCPPE